MVGIALFDTWVKMASPLMRCTNATLRSDRRGVPRILNHRLVQNSVPAHYSQRPTLKKALNEQIAKAAAQRGESHGKLMYDLVDPDHEHRDLLVEIVANGIDAIAASKSEKEMAKNRDKK